MKKNLLTLLLAFFAIATTAQAQVYVPGERVSTIQENTKYFIFNTAYTPGAYSDRWGFVYFDGSVKTYSGAVPESFTTSDANYLFTFTNNGDNTYTLNSVGQDSEVGNTFTLTPWMDAEDRGDAQVRNDDGTFTPNDEISEADKVWTIHNGEAYWNGNNWYGIGTNSFALWSDAHPYAIYTAIEKNQAEGLLLNADNFPDANFRAALASKLGISEGDEITAEKIAKTTSLSVSSIQIADLTGVEHFTALKTLYCDANKLTSLDVSKNTALTELDCGDNQLTSLNVSQNTALKRLYCYDNQLTSLDVSKNTALTTLSCGSNQLTSLDVSKNTALTRLRCAYNQLTSLDVSKNTALTELYCSYNQLTSLDVSQNTALEELYCYSNQLTSLNVSGCTALKDLWCICNQIKGKEMDALVASLPTVSKGDFYVIDTTDENEGNVCTKSQVAVAKEKGWTVYDFNGSFKNSQEYEGSEDAAAGLLLNAENFPDANFRAALASILGISEGDEITEAKIAATTTLDVPFKNISDLTGIEHFTALKELICQWNQLTSLDVSKNTALTILDCFRNQLTSLDVSKNTKLSHLDCQDNQLTSLDVSKNTALRYLHCWVNKITSLDVSKNTKLTFLSCSGNQLTSLDVSKNTALTTLSCGDNQLTSLDVSKNTALTRLSCNENQLTSLDVSKNTALTSLDCGANPLTSFDVSKNTELVGLYCNGNQLTSLDVSKNTALKYLYCYSNQIKGEAMDVLVNDLPTAKEGEYYEFVVINTWDKNEGNVCTKSQVAVAKEKGWLVSDYQGNRRPDYEGSDDATGKLLLNADNFPDANFRAALASKLGISEGDEITDEMIAATTSINVNGYNKAANEKIADLTGIEHFTALTELICIYNQLTSLDVSKNTALTDLGCYNNQLTSLDVSKNTALTYLGCFGNQLTSLDVSKNTALTELYCSYNQLTSLDVSKNTALTELGCNNNQLTSLDVSQNTALTNLSCGSNKLTSLDVSKNTALTRLRCDYNQMTSLDVSKNTALEYLSCDNNQLVSLDVSQNTALTELSCYRNQLTSLDMSQNTALTKLRCEYNQLTSLDVSKNTKLTVLYCYYNQLTSLDVSKNTALKSLVCYNNQLTSLDVSKNTALTELVCFRNQIKGEAMDALVASLPTVQNGKFYVIDTTDENEGNVCTKSQVAVAKGKGWTVYDFNGSSSNKQEYEGSEDADEELEALRAELLEYLDVFCSHRLEETKWMLEEKATIEQAPDLYAQCENLKWRIAKVREDINKASTKEDLMYWRYELEQISAVIAYLRDQINALEIDIDPVDEDDNIDYGSDMDENSNLDGNVIGDIFYNISSGNGEYNSEEGCIVVTKPTDDGTVDELEGKDIFGEDFKSQFTGIVFKVPAGKGTIKVDAETTGNMLLKVKIGSGDPVEMELNGKLKVTFPYNVSEATYVYIYAGAANEAKGFGKASATDAALKIYGIEFLRDDTPTDIDRPTPDPSLNEGDSWYTIDGVKLNGEPGKKGIYIHNGKKVVK